MSKDPEQIERHFHEHKNHGGYIRRSRYTDHLKKMKKRIERRKGKVFVEEIVVKFSDMEWENEYAPDYETYCEPAYNPTYNKYMGWEY